MYDKIQAADANFASLPAEIRQKFNNDTGQFLEFVNNDENIEAMQEMGLIPKPAVDIEVVEPAVSKTEEVAVENNEE